MTTQMLPAENQTNVSVKRKGVLRRFNQRIVLGEGSARLRKGSQDGDILEEISVSSGKASISGSELILYPENQLPYETKVFLTMDVGFVCSEQTGEKCNFLTETSEKTFCFTTEDPIGKSLDGGTIVSKEGGRYLIASPIESEISLKWDNRAQAISHTESITGTTGWFIPSASLLLNDSLNWYGFHDEDSCYMTEDKFVIDMSKSFSHIKKINTNTTNKIRTFKFSNI